MNTMYPSGRNKRRYLSKRGKEFKQYVQFALKNWINTKRLTHLGDSRVEVHYEFYFKGKRKRDASNYVKATEDCLSGIIIDDDEQVDYFSVRRIYNAPRNYIIIEIIAI